MRIVGRYVNVVFYNERFYGPKLQYGDSHDIGESKICW